MELKAIVAVEFREAQYKHRGAAAGGQVGWSEFNDSAERHISERLVELAGVRWGSWVLDVAAGDGEPALIAACKVGPVQGFLVDRFAQRIKGLLFVRIPDEALAAVLAHTRLALPPLGD